MGRGSGTDKDASDKGKQPEKKSKKKFGGKRAPTHKSDYSVVISDQASGPGDSALSLGSGNTTSTSTTKASGSTTSMQRNVGAENGVRQAAPSKLKDWMKPEYLKDLRKRADRGTLDLVFVKIGKGLGEFEDVVDATEAFAKADGTDDQARAAALLSAIDAYLTPDRRKAFDKERAKGPKADKTTIRKMDAVTNLRREARRFLQNPIDSAFLTTPLDTAQAREKAHGDRATALKSAFGGKRAPSGTSEVQLIGGADGVAYAFKPIDKESVQTGMPQGAGAVREVMGSVMSNTLRDLSRGVLDFGFPQTQVVSLGDSSGALVEGINGMSYDGNWLEGKATSVLGPKKSSPDRDDFASVDEFRIARAAHDNSIRERDALMTDLLPESERRKEEARRLAQKLPAKAIQKVLLCNFAMAQFDIKWDNLMMVEDDDGVSARPFDAGAGFLSDEAIEKDDAGNGMLLSPGEGGPGYLLLADPTNGRKKLPTASEPLDDELRKAFLDIDLDVLKQTLEDERTRLAKDHGLGKDVLSDNSMARTYRAMANLKEILADKKVVTTEDLVATFCSRLGELRKPT